MLNIRGHHLLCMFGFEGMGYNDQFVENMAGIVDSFFGRKECKIILRAECDDICTPCPNRWKKVCAKSTGSEQRVKDKDMTIIEKLGLECDQQYFNHDIIHRVKDRISPSQLSELCTGCEWLEMDCCIRGLERMKRNSG